MTALLNHAQVKPLLSDEHFSVDGTLIEAWASQKSFRPKDGSGDADGGANFHGQTRKNDTHASTSDPDSRLYRKAAGREAKLSFNGSILYASVYLALTVVSQLLLNAFQSAFNNKAKPADAQQYPPQHLVGVGNMENPR
jgi:hypothetical protein